MICSSPPNSHCRGGVEKWLSETVKLTLRDWSSLEYIPVRILGCKQQKTIMFNLSRKIIHWENIKQLPEMIKRLENQLLENSRNQRKLDGQNHSQIPTSRRSGSSCIHLLAVMPLKTGFPTLLLCITHFS